MIRVVDEDLGRVGPAKPHRMLDDRLEDRLELEAGSTDCRDHLFVAACCSSNAEYACERAAG